MDRRVALPLVLLVSACIHVYQSIRPRPLDPHTPVTVTTPVKVHLVDGSTVVFLAGLTVDSAQVRGDGNRYSLTLRDSAAVNSIPLDSIVGMEAFEQSVNGFPSFFVSVLATGGAALVVGGLAVAIFGSCATVYADSAVTVPLMAEDGHVYRTAAQTMAQTQLSDLDDWIDLTAPAPPGADSVAIVLRLRNSLLNTTLLYDVMLGEPGARSLDWVGKDLKQVGPAIEVAPWYQQWTGM